MCTRYEKHSYEKYIPIASLNELSYDSRKGHFLTDINFLTLNKLFSHNIQLRKTILHISIYNTKMSHLPYYVYLNIFYQHIVSERTFFDGHFTRFVGLRNSALKLEICSIFVV